jgi:hypothetical protein
MARDTPWKRASGAAFWGGRRHYWRILARDISASFLPNQQVLSFLHELRGRTMPAYHTKPAADGGAGAARQ